MIDGILSFSVRQRWLIVLLTMAACVAGAWALVRVPIDAVPDITNNQVQINTLAPALSPIDVEKQVTYPIETALAGIPGLEYTRSLNRNGFSQVTAVFTDRTDIYFARQQISERLTEARRTIPPGIDPKMGPVSTGLAEIYMWSVHYAPRNDNDAVREGRPGWQSDGTYLTPEGQRLRTEFERATYLRTVQDWIIRPQLKNVRGVAGIDVVGGYVKQYHVEPEPAKLIGFGLSFSDLAAAIEKNNVNRGASYVERNGEGYVVRSAGRLESIDDIREVVIATREAVPIRVKDVASVRIGRELRTGSASRNGEEAVIGTALMLIGANSRTVAAAVDEKLQEINKGMPPGVRTTPVLNRSVLVEATIETVATNLAEGALLVVLVLFLLLGNFRAALITAMVIPIAMLMTAMGMLQGRISANLMSLGALDFGLIVDGAVIITENSLRHLAERQRTLGRPLDLPERLETVTLAAREMVRPTVYGQVVIILVYIPMLAFSGVEGKMFEPMALTVIIALVAAFILSLTFVPAMIAIVVSGRVRERENMVVRSLKVIYAPILSRTIRSPRYVISAAVGLFAGALLLFANLGQEFVPTLDEKNVLLQAVRIPSTGLLQSQEMQFQIEKALSGLPEVAYVFSKTGTGEMAVDPMPQNISDTYVMLKPSHEWPDPDLPKETLIRRIQETAEQLPGNNFELTQPIQMRFNELLAGVRGDVAVKVFGDEFAPMLRAANQIATILRGIEGATDVRVEQTSGLPFLEITVDKAEIARRGLNISAVQDVIGAAIGGREAGVVFEGDRRFDIVLRLPEEVRINLEELKSLPVSLPQTSRSGMAPTIPLKQVATFTTGEGPNQISRENGKRRVVVTANVRGRDIASIVAEARGIIEVQVQLPTGYWIAWGGQFENLAAARQRLAIVVPGCFFLIFLLLYAALGATRDALIVFSAVPLALTGGVVALWLRDMPFSVSAAVGFIALSGVAVLNGLVMLTSMRQSMVDGLPLRKAIEHGALTRLRPVVITALVASLGFLPMALATGTGAEVQKPLATVVIGGLITATLLTLLVLPALYAWFGSALAAKGVPPSLQATASAE